MDGYFDNFMEIISRLSDADKLNKAEINYLATNLKKVYKGLNTCGRKMTSSTNFIDFFVHDILDYTILNKDENNFSKDLTIFDIEVALN